MEQTVEYLRLGGGNTCPVPSLFSQVLSGVPKKTWEGNNGEGVHIHGWNKVERTG